MKFAGFHIVFALFACAAFCALERAAEAAPHEAAAQASVGSESVLPYDERQTFARYVRFRPANGETVTLNPPRMSWPYKPEIAFGDGTASASQRFVLQICSTPDFQKPEVEVKDTPCNFYNFLPVLRGADRWHWRVGYGVGTRDEQWSKTRTFTLAPGAVEWDRSDFPAILDSVSGHPRMLFNAANREKILALKDTDPGSAEVYKAILKNADAILQSKTYVNFPKNDNKAMNYMPLGEDLTLVGFAYALTGDEKYAGVLERLTTMASWPKGGKSGPEGIVSMKWNTHLTEFMGLLYDWLYDKLTPRQRAIVKESLEWRLDYTLNNFAYRQKNGTIVNRGSIAAQCGSHPYQNIMAILPGALAICDESAIARETLEVGLHYITGIANGHGEDEAWMDGPGYGNGKMKWLVNATWPLLTAMPELHLEKNEAYSAYTDFFAHLTPIGARHCSFGNRGYNETDWSASRTYNFRSMAMLRGDSHAMQNWLDTVRRLQEIDRAPSRNLYIEYVLPAYFTEPSPKPEDDGVGLFPLEGWISASSAPPSDYDAQREAVSMVFACRPRGGAGHSFRNENAFDIHAYGETLASGGCSTYNLNKYANDAMSHNTVLIEGKDQEAAKSADIPLCGRLIAFKQGDGFVYWAGDATPAYGAQTGLGKFVRHVAFVDNAYFVIYDELETAPNAKPARFQWLYHIPEYTPVAFDAADFSFRYEMKRAGAVVKHLAHADDLQLIQLRGEEGWANPIDGRKYSAQDDEPQARIAKNAEAGIDKQEVTAADANHLWVCAQTPRTSMRFLAVVAPYRAGEAPATIERVSDAAARISFRGKTTTVSFDPAAPGDLAIDAAAISAAP